jgi:integrase
VVWYYRFNAPGTTRENRREIREFGFATKEEATKAEAARRIEEEKRHDMAKSGAGVVAAVPTTLEKLLREFMAQHAEEKLAPKTVERYHEEAAYLDPALLQMPIADIKPLHLSREWSRLLKCGGHTRKKKTPRPLSAKTVRNIAGVVSSAYSRAIRWGLVATNPVTNSEPPRARKHLAIALTPAQHDTVMNAASGPWCLRAYLEIASATGCRRGELLALRWSDIVDGCAIIARSLTQTNAGLEFKGTKTEKPRTVVLPPSAIVVLDDHRREQDAFRLQFGPDYCKDLDLIFANPDGTMLKPDSISASVSAIFRRLKIPKPKGNALHLLRHSHTSILLAAGVPLPAVSARLGHSSVRTTQEIYAHMITGQDEEAARKWEEYQRRNRPAAGDGQQKPQVQ